MRPHMRRAALLLALTCSAGWGRAAEGATVDVSVDATLTHQVMEGFGAGHQPQAMPGRADLLTPSQRTRGIAAVYGEVAVTTGYLDTAILESPGTYDERRNDNADPSVIDWNGFQTFREDAVKTNIVDPAQPLGFTDYLLAERINVRWASPWLAAIRTSDYDRFLNEAAEQVAAGQTYWRDRYGIVPRYQLLFNEPLSGNGELYSATEKQVVDLIKRVGARLRSDGFADVKFLVPNEETVDRTVRTTRTILSDSAARQYVGAIGYHAYPYGSPYASISQILATSGKGQPVAAQITARNELRDLGKQYGIPLWMTEISHGGSDPRSFDALRARAIHIHDELLYADAAAYLAFSNISDLLSHQAHTGNSNLYSTEGTLVFIDQSRDTVTISGLGYAIGHYARWIKKGAVRLDATSVDPLLQVTAFRDPTQNRLVLVLINNAATAQSVRIALNGVQVSGPVTGEQSTAAAAWQALAPVAPADGGQTIAVTLPSESVTTLSGLAGPLPTNTVATASPGTSTPTRPPTRLATSTATPPVPTVTQIPTSPATATATRPVPSPTATSVVTPVPGRGDANCDGQLSAPDVSAEVQFIANGTRAVCGHDDLNADGTVDERDIPALLQALFQATAGA